MTSKYKIVKTFDQIKVIVERCKQTGYCSFDFETKAQGGPHSKSDDVTILGISYQVGFGWSIPIFHFDSPFSKAEVKEIFTYLFIHIFENPKVIKIAFNAKHELKWVNRYGGDIKGIYLDAMLAKYLLDEEPPNDLKSLTSRFIPEFGDYEDEIHRLVKQYGGWGFVPLKPLSKYCCIDCDMTFRLLIYFENLLLNEKKYPRFYALFRNMCMMQTRVYADSEMMGMGVNKKYLDKIELDTRNQIKKNESKLLGMRKIVEFQRWRTKKHVEKLIKTTQEEIEKIEADESKTDASKVRMIRGREEKISRYIAGNLITKKEVMGEVNFNSPPQMVDLLFESSRGFRFKIIKYTKDKLTKQDTTKPSTDEEVLLLLKKKDKTGFIPALLKHRELSKLWSTYMVAIQNRLTENNRIHSSFKIHGTVTGRMSSADPNLHNIPRDNTSSIIKVMYIPPPGHLVLEVDYGQAELRVVAEIANEKALIDIFERGYNVHLATACKMQRCMERYDEIKKILKDPSHKENLYWEKQKKKGKTLNFSILFGQSDEETADQMTADNLEMGIKEIVTLEDAKRFKGEWHREFPAIKPYMKNQEIFCRRHKYVVNIFGRRRNLADIDSERAGFYNKAVRDAINAPVQGGSSDFAQFACSMIRHKIITGQLKLSNNLKYQAQANSVHDSIKFYAEPRFIHKAVPIIESICSQPETLKYFGFELKKVKMKVSPEVGINWGQMRDYDPKENYESWLQK